MPSGAVGLWEKHHTFHDCGFGTAYKRRYFFDGKRVNQVEAEDRDIGMVFQNYALYPHMTVGRNIEFPLRMRHIAKAQREKG